MGREGGRRLERGLGRKSRTKREMAGGRKADLETGITSL